MIGRLLLLVLAGSILIISIFSCSESPNGLVPSSPVRLPEDYMYIGEKILVEELDELDVYYVAKDHIFFDLSQDSLIASGGCFDVLVDYLSESRCDYPHYVYDFKSGNWVMIATRYWPSGCGESQRRFAHALSSATGSARDVLGDSLRLKIRLPNFQMAEYYLPFMQHTVRILRINPKYRPLQLAKDSILHFSELACDLEDYWVTRDGTVYRFSRAGQFLEAFDCGMDPIKGLTLGGDCLWMAGSDRVIRAAEDGSDQESFTLERTVSGLTWVDGNLWTIMAEGSSYRLLAIDPEASLASGKAVVYDSVASPVAGSDLSWDGSAFLIAGEMLYEVSPAGIVRASHVWPTGNQGNIEYFRGLLYINGKVTIAPYQDDPVLTTFRIQYIPGVDP